MERPLLNILLYNGSELNIKFGLFFIWSSECVGETDFGQFIIMNLVK